jgi:putative ABC transport system permease protein
MLQDYKLGVRMLLKYPGLTLAGGLALAIAIGVGAGWYDLMRKFMSPEIPLPEGDRIVSIETHNALTNEAEPRVLHDFLEWRRVLRTVEELGAFRTHTRNLIIDRQAPAPIQTAEITAAAFGAAHATSLLGRTLLASDEIAGAPAVIVLGFDVWQRSFEGRNDIIGSIVKLEDTPVTVVGVMPEGFGYPFNHHAWTPLMLRDSYAALEGDAIGVIGRLAPGISPQQANAELRVLGERAAAELPATHQHLRARVIQLGGQAELARITQIALTNVPALLVLLIACTTVGTLIYARTATREGEIAVRFALGATRARILSQLFVETFVLTSIAAAVGLTAADRAVTFVIQTFNRSTGGLPFWMTSGLMPATILYAGALAVAGAVLLSVLPALRATRACVQPHLGNLGSGGATLRFGRVWTAAMIGQVALTTMGIPVAMEGVNEMMLKVNARARFPSREYHVARLDIDRMSGEQRGQALERFAQRISQEPGVVAVTFADRVPGSGFARSARRRASIEVSPGGPAFSVGVGTSAVGAEFFETFDRAIVSGRAFNGSDRSPEAQAVIVNEAFVRAFQRLRGSGSPIGARLRYSDLTADGESFEIVGVVRDLGLDPDDEGHEASCVFHFASPGDISPVAMSVRVRGNSPPLAASLPAIAAEVAPRLLVREAQRLDESIRQRDRTLMATIGAGLAVTALVLFLSALGIFSLVSISVSRRTREIGIRTALGATARDVLGGILARATMLMGSGIIAGGALLVWALALGAGPTGRPADDVSRFMGYLGMTAFVMLVACLFACISPARRALRINPAEALRQA